MAVQPRLRVAVPLRPWGEMFAGADALPRLARLRKLPPNTLCLDVISFKVYFVFCMILAVYSWDLSMERRTDCAGSALHPGERAEYAREVLRIGACIRETQAMHAECWQGRHACGWLTAQRAFAAYNARRQQPIRAHRRRTPRPAAGAVRMHPPADSLSPAVYYHIGALVCPALSRYCTSADARCLASRARHRRVGSSARPAALSAVVDRTASRWIAPGAGGTLPTAMGTARRAAARFPMLVASRTLSRLKTCRPPPVPVVVRPFTRSRPQETPLPARLARITQNTPTAARTPHAARCLPSVTRCPPRTVSTVPIHISLLKDAISHLLFYNTA
ncbi:hypothetical protein GGX14DRAFT_596427 [Mycena pura]|uniref:Uncharacterized protein n=1 Tax=Mycena pura TaxID=153505 RepID=A0AAD6USY6_9AGAR|nr:hypothetical protein GGX14DRAFT_596427 [Mycena pura]